MQEVNMVTLIIILILALNKTLFNANIDTTIGLSLLGLLSEIMFIWFPIKNYKVWFKKMSYFKYLYKVFF